MWAKRGGGFLCVGGGGGQLFGRCSDRMGFEDFSSPGLQAVIVAFAGHTHLLYNPHTVRKKTPKRYNCW